MYDLQFDGPDEYVGYYLTAEVHGLQPIDANGVVIIPGGVENNDRGGTVLMGTSNNRGNRTTRVARLIKWTLVIALFMLVAAVALRQNGMCLEWPGRHQHYEVLYGESGNRYGVGSSTIGSSNTSASLNSGKESKEPQHATLTRTPQRTCGKHPEPATHMSPTTELESTMPRRFAPNPSMLDQPTAFETSKRFTLVTM
jgi:hypothetical protein